MKISKTLACGSVTASLLLTGAMVANVSAQQAVKETQGTAQVAQKSGLTVTVPEGSGTVKYTVDGQEYKILPGNSGFIPEGATKVKLTKGCEVRVTKVKDNGKVAVTHYTVDSAVEVAVLDVSGYETLNGAMSVITALDKVNIIPGPATATGGKAGGPNGNTGVNPSNVLGPKQTDGND
ncbi:hypothetical protein Rhal01_01391 [Rubritalea halochordaticola]|uniref:Uncharacterized protein n=1 Tax=Rubritalea halochordaticola TaxID=714537 RepID=A0ABP9V289_9BACT